jgi:hypothetical protein
VKKIPKPDLDSDDDDLFNTKKKQTPTAPIVEQKDKTNVENGTVSVKDRAVKRKKKKQFSNQCF